MSKSLGVSKITPTTLIASLVVCAFASPINAFKPRVSASAFLWENAPRAGLNGQANGKIAFTSNRDGNYEIYVMNSDGSNQTRLTNNPAQDNDPSWSPDGSRIAFTSDRAVVPDIYLMNADGSNQINLTNSPERERTPAWAPDGSRIVFASSGNDPFSSDLYVINPDGRNRTRILNMSGSAINPAFVLSPAWSPDGNKIAFVRRNGTASASLGAEIYVMSADGESLINLTNGAAWDESPAWSPDGTRLAFASSGTPWDYGSGLYLMNADGTNRTGVTATSVNYDPDWSPDGTRIVGSNGDIYTVEPDGSDQVRLTNTSEGSNWEPDWQPLPLLTSSPIDDERFFVRQHYLDFLNREPDQGGWDYWTSRITECSNDPLCLHRRRIEVSAAFFIELEFQQTGYVVYRLHRGAHVTSTCSGPEEVQCSDACTAPCMLQRRAKLTHSQFVADRAQLVGGPGLPQNTIAFANSFVQRPEFKQLYPDAMSPSDFVNKLFDTADLTSSANVAVREAAIAALTNGSKTRAQVLLDLIEIDEFKTREYNPAFVLMQYFGYLDRDPDEGGYSFWLDVLNNHVPGNFRSMVCAFITSSEYQLRFGSAITRSNKDCAQ